MNSRDPSTFPRRILLAVTGLSPQVVTETLYALAVGSDTPFVPTEIHLITTREGAERARLALLSADPGWFHRLRRDYALPEIVFDEPSLHVLHDADGAALDDIRTPGDNERAADALTETVRGFTADPDCALHVSIAGGRKTMGFYLGYALSLFGREQDRLSHVLVSEPFESSWDFFYPTPYSRIITTRDNKLADTARAQVTLADIPFVRLRDGLPDDLLAGDARFSAAVAEAQRTLPVATLELDPAARRVSAGGENVSLRPAEFAFYWWLAERCQLGRPGAHWTDEGVEQELLAYYKRVVNPNSGDCERMERALARGIAKENVDPYKSHINAAFKQALGARRARPFLIVRMEPIPGTRYRRFGLALSPDSIRIAASPEHEGSHPLSSRGLLHV